MREIVITGENLKSLLMECNTNSFNCTRFSITDENLIKLAKQKFGIEPKKIEFILNAVAFEGQYILSGKIS